MNDAADALERLVNLESEWRAMRRDVEANTKDINELRDGLRNVQDSVLKFNMAATFIMWLGSAILAILTLGTAFVAAFRPFASSTHVHPGAGD